MKNNYLMETIGLLILAIIAIAIYYISLFHIGDPKLDTLHVEHIGVTKDLIELDGRTDASGDAYKNYEYEVKGKYLYITIKYVLASNSYRSGDFAIQINGDFTNVEQIYLTDGKNNKLIWQDDPVTTVKTPITLPADRITSGLIKDGRVGGVLQYQMTPDELKAFINYFNLQQFTENDKKEGSSDRDSLSDSTDVILRMDDGKNIYVMGYLDGETAVTNSDGSGYLLNDPELTDYLSVTMAGILKENGEWN